MSRYGFVALAMCFVALTTSCLGDECEDAWVPDIKRGLVCADEPARCTQVGMQPDRALGFVARLVTADAAGKPIAAGTLKFRAQCVAKFMSERAVFDIVIAPDNTSVAANGTLRRIGPALEFSVVKDYTTNCGTAGGCASCAQLPPDACTSDTFCALKAATPTAGEAMPAAAMCGPM